MRVYRDTDIPIEVTQGQVFTISLVANPSTGYVWNAEYNAAIIDLLKPKKFIPSAVGGKGEEIFEFLTKQAGDTQIKMKYQRGWEKVPQEVKIFRISIKP